MVFVFSTKVPHFQASKVRNILARKVFFYLCDRLLYKIELLKLVHRPLLSIKTTGDLLTANARCWDHD